jgi:hypothetical protein
LETNDDKLGGKKKRGKRKEACRRTNFTKEEKCNGKVRRENKGINMPMERINKTDGKTKAGGKTRKYGSFYFPLYL